MLWAEDSASPMGRKIPFLISHMIKHCALTKRAYRWFAARLQNVSTSVWWARCHSAPTGGLQGCDQAIATYGNFRRGLQDCAQAIATYRTFRGGLQGCAQAIATYRTFRIGMSYEIQ